MGTVGLELVETYEYQDLDWTGPWAAARRQVHHAVAAAELTTAPNLALLGEPNEANAAARLRSTATRILSQVCLQPRGLDLELRYVLDPSGSPNLRLLLVVRAQGPDALTAASAANQGLITAQSAFPGGYSWEPASPTLATPTFARDLAIAELRRQEEVAEAAPWVPDAEFYYSPGAFAGDGSGWAAFLRTLAGHQGRAVVSIGFMPAQLSARELSVIDHLIGSLQRHRNDPGAVRANRRWVAATTGLDQAVLVRMSVLADGNDGSVELIGKAFSTAVSERTSMDLALEAPRLERPTTRETDAWARFAYSTFAVVPWGGHEIWRTAKRPEALARLPYLYPVDQAAGCFALPVPDAQGCRGFAVTARSVARRSALNPGVKPLDGVILGRGIEEGADGAPFSLALGAINRHVLVVGSPGSGKTTTVLTLLAELWRTHGIPFLAIEPVKTEYRALKSMDGLSDTLILTPGKEALSPVRLNPLEVPPGRTRVEQQAVVLAELLAVLPLDPPLPQLLERSLDDAYARFGWTEESVASDNLPTPTLEDVLTALEIASGTLEYSADVRGTVVEALRIRLRSLMIGSKGRLLNTAESTDWSDVMTRPTVLELNGIADPVERAIVTAFVVGRIQTAARARGSSGGRLLHVTVLEEAHQLLGASSAPGSPQAAAVEILANAIAEMRAVGEGFVIADQRPSALAASAISNSGSRFIHRLTSASDRDIVLRDASAGHELVEIAARLKTGQALVSWPDSEDLELMAVSPATGVDTSTPMSDEIVCRQSADSRHRTLALLPSTLCTRAICTTGCVPVRRDRGEQIARSIRGSRPGIFNGSQGLPDAIVEVAEAAAGDRALAYCALVAGLRVEGRRELVSHPLTDIVTTLVAYADLATKNRTDLTEVGAKE